MRRRTVFWLLGALGFLLIAEVALVVAVVTAPDDGGGVRDRIVGVRTFFAGDDDTPGVFERAGSALGDATSALARLLSGEQARPKSGETEFGECTSCHPDYATKQRFSATYFDHPQHAELGTGCPQCHVDTAHPNPELPSEQVCGKCHTGIHDETKCTRCHPPGSLPHFYRAGFPREGPIECDSCHEPGQFTVGDGGVPLPVVDRSDERTCTTCHDQTKCESCHATHPTNWVQIHGNEASGDPTSCADCHDTLTCATECHTDASRMDELSPEGQEGAP